MATSGTHVDVPADTGHSRTVSTEQNIYVQRLLALRRGRTIESNQGLITAFAFICCFVVIVTYLETSRVLLPSKVVTTRELRTLTSGFTNDLPVKHSSKDQSWAAIGHLHPRRPRVLFVGFSHCGGKGTLSVLGAHPDVTVNKREVKYFTGNASLKWYLSHMPPSPPHHITIDACWSCIINKSALTKIKSFNETIKIVVIICDPISRLLATHARLSNQSHRPTDDNPNSGNLKPYDFDSLKSKISVNFSLLNNLKAQILTDNGDYFRHVVDMFELFTRKQVLVLDQDRFRRKFVSELYRLQKFIGVTPQTEMNGMSYDKDREILCYNFNPGPQTCLADTSQNITEIFALEPGLLKSLKQFYKPFNRRLFLYLNHKFNWA